LIERYFEDGILKFTNLLTSTQINIIRNEIDHFSKLDIGTKIFEKDEVSIRSIMSYHNKNDILNYFTSYKPIAEVVESIIGTRVYVSQSKINLKSPAGIGKKWEYHRGFTFWHLLDGKPNQDMVSVFICLSKQTIENGAVFILEKSHKGFDVP